MSNIHRFYIEYGDLVYSDGSDGKIVMGDPETIKRKIKRAELEAKNDFRSYQPSIPDVHLSVTGHDIAGGAVEMRQGSNKIYVKVEELTEFITAIEEVMQGYARAYMSFTGFSVLTNDEEGYRQFAVVSKITNDALYISSPVALRDTLEEIEVVLLNKENRK